MSTINTIDDLVRIVRENQEYRAVLRRELLTDDLLALPAQFVEMRSTQNDMRDTQNSILKTQSELIETQNRILLDLAETRSTQRDMLRTQNEMLITQRDMLKTQSEILRRLDNVEAHSRRLSDDFGNFRGSYAGIAVVKHAAGIAIRLDEAKSLGIDELATKVLSREMIRALAGEYGSERLASIPRSERESFYLSDLIIEVAKTDGTTCYIAVEASYTCNGRDTARALSHADLITRFTGKEAWPVIAGVRMDRQIQPLVDGGQVFWYSMEDEEMEPENPS